MSGQLESEPVGISPAISDESVVEVHNRTTGELQVIDVDEDQRATPNEMSTCKPSALAAFSSEPSVGFASGFSRSATCC